MVCLINSIDNLKGKSRPKELLRTMSSFGEKTNAMN